MSSRRSTSPAISSTEQITLADRDARSDSSILGRPNASDALTKTEFADADLGQDVSPRARQDNEGDWGERHDVKQGRVPDTFVW
jgi:hypothetical protein